MANDAQLSVVGNRKSLLGVKNLPFDWTTNQSRFKTRPERMRNLQILDEIDHAGLDEMRREQMKIHTKSFVRISQLKEI